MITDEMKNEEWYVIFNMNCKYEICRMCPKSGLFKGSYEECEKWIKQKKKEEKKDEMKNRISMALKDPTLQQGFEVICKNLAELEKENAELKGLKDVATLIRANNDTVTTLMQLNNMLVSKTQQLTKAKDHIKKLLDCLKQDTNDPQTNYYVCQYMDKAEQFISEVEK